MENTKIYKLITKGPVSNSHFTTLGMVRKLSFRLFYSGKTSLLFVWNELKDTFNSQTIINFKLSDRNHNKNIKNKTSQI